MRILISACLVAISAGVPDVARAGDAPAGRAMVVADFEDSVRTAQGGMFFCVGARPDRVRDGLVRTGAPERGAWRIELSADAPSVGAGGVVPLYDTCPVVMAGDDNGASSGSPGIDVSGVPHLHLRLIGELGERRLRVEAITGKAVGPETVGITVGTLPPAAVEGSRWQETALSLSDGGLDLKRLTGLRLLIEGTGPAWLAVDSIRFAEGAGELPEPSSAPAKAHSLRYAMWSWQTESILAEPARREALIAFCRERGITDLFSQVDYTYDEGRVTLRQADSQRQLNSLARRSGIRVHALDGHRSYALAANHPRMVKLVEALIRFNEEGPEEARFHGVHLDNEPYLLDEWKNEVTRPMVLNEYYQLNRRLAPMTRAGGLEFGLDIPFWWDKVDESGRAVFRVSTDSGEKPLLEAIFPLLQNVGIMSYRERVTGCNGVVSHCRVEFALGQRCGVDVFASIETGAGERYEDGTTFGPYSRAYFVWQLDMLKRVLAQEPGCSGLAIHAYNHYRGLLEKQP